MKLILETPQANSEEYTIFACLSLPNFVLLNNKIYNNMARSKIALITGGSRGLGKNMAIAIAKKGLDVILTYNSQKAEADTVVAEIEALGQKAATLQLNAVSYTHLTLPTKA